MPRYAASLMQRMRRVRPLLQSMAASVYDIQKHANPRTMPMREPNGRFLKKQRLSKAACYTMLLGADLCTASPASFPVRALPYAA